jgi:methyl-accepting chemotaxis protein
MKTKSRRRRFFIDPQFQVRHIVGFAIFGAIAALIVGGVVAYLFLFELPKTRVDQRFWGPEFLSNLTWVILAVVVVASLWSVFVSHKVVGPMFRLKKVMRAVGEGDLTYRVRFRTRDRLKDVGAACDEMIVGLGNLVSADRNCAAQISATAKKARQTLDREETVSDAVKQVRSLLDEIVSKADSIAGEYKIE